MKKYNKKIAKLAALLAGYKKVAIAFSGGSDSLFLLYMASTVIGKENVLALTARSDFFSDYEEKHAIDFTKTYDIPHIFLDVGMEAVPEFAENNTKRCYFCKTHIASNFINLSREKGFFVLAEGTNADDVHDIREGFRAVGENGLKSPLLEAGLTKKDIAVFLKEQNMLRWLRPSSACLASRVPYGIRITKEVLKTIEKGENYLRSLGLKQVRLRHHGDIARIEVPLKEIKLLTSKEAREKTVSFLNSLGYKYAALDLGGFVSGSLNK